MKINKKWLYGFGALGAVAAPVATVISCGETEIDMSKFEWKANTTEIEATTTGELKIATMKEFAGLPGAGNEYVNIDLQYSLDGAAFAAVKDLTGLTAASKLKFKLVPKADYTLGAFKAGQSADSPEYTVKLGV